MQPDADQRQHGFYMVFAACLLNGLHPATAAALRTTMSRGLFSCTTEPTVRPDVIVIQSESLFDARRLGPTVCVNLLSNFDAACAEAVRYGQPEVPAWGANTMHTEFAVLSGLDSGAQGYARPYPYAYIRQSCASLAEWFRRADYRTSAMHLYHGDSFGRHRVLSLMHFNRLFDIRHFSKAQRMGPYVVDLVVAGTIQVKLEAVGDLPAFVFAMTIENYGLLRLKHATPGEVTPHHAFGEGKLWNDLAAHLRHLVNAGAMIGQLTYYLAIRKYPAVLYFYDDHMLVLSAAYRQTDHLPTHNDYLLWCSDVASAPPSQQKRMRMYAESLGKLLVNCISALLPASQNAGTSRTDAASIESQQQQQ